VVGMMAKKGQVDFMKILTIILILILIYIVWVIISGTLMNPGRDIGRVGGLVIKPFFGFAPFLYPKKGKRKGDSEFNIAFWIIFGFMILLVVLVFLKYLSTYLDKIPSLLGTGLKRRGLI
jgi:hypothetical protein